MLNIQGHFFFFRWAFSKQGVESVTEEHDDILQVDLFCCSSI